MGPLVFQGALGEGPRLYRTGGGARGQARDGRPAEPPRPSSATGYFIEPTVLGGVENPMGIAREEVFGPVLTVIRFDDVEQARRHADASGYGLAAGVFTHDVAGTPRRPRPRAESSG